MGLWIAAGVGALALVAGISAVVLMNRQPSMSTAFRPSEVTSPNTTNALGSASNSNTGNGTTETIELISGTVGPEITKANSPTLKLAEEFANHVRQGSSYRAIGMITSEGFERRFKDGPKASWEAIVEELDTSKVLAHLQTTSLDSTPLDEGFRHWRVLGETVYDGQPAALLRYYCDPEYPRQLISDPNKMKAVTNVISMEEFKSNANDLVLYNAKDRNHYLPPEYPDTIGFLPPRFGYMLLVFDKSGDNPKVVDIVNVLGQVPLSQMAGFLYLLDWYVLKLGKEPEYAIKQRKNEANAVGRKSFSIYGTVLKSPGSGLTAEDIPAPKLWFLPPEGKYAKTTFDLGPQEVARWLPQQTPSRTTQLVKLASSLDQSSPEATGLFSEFKRLYPGDPGADLSVISFAMTSIEPRMPESLLSVIDQSAESLFKTFNDPFMLYVRGLVQQAKGDQAASARFMQQANQAGFVSMRMLRQPFEQAVQSGDKDVALATLKQIGVYWSTKAVLDKSSNVEGQFNQVWEIAQSKAQADKDRIAQEKNSGGFAQFNPGNNSEPSPFGRAAPPGLQGGRFRSGGDPGATGANLDPSAGPMNREPGFAGPQGVLSGGNPSSPVAPGFAGGPPGPGFPGGFPPTPDPSSANVRFILESKSSLDANAILDKLKNKLKVGNHQMSYSGNNATITLGFAGPFEDAVKAVDFGKVTKKDQATRTINVGIP